MILGWTCFSEGYDAFGRLAESVLTGRSGFELAFGQSFHDYLASHPDRSGVYGAATDSTVEALQGAVDTYDFSTARTVLDVGGGGGAFLTCLLRRYRLIRGVLFEIPGVIERVSLADDVAARIECAAGDAARADTDGLPQGDAPASRLLACEMGMSAKPLAPSRVSMTFRRSRCTAAVTAIETLGSGCSLRLA
jgi:O-methyltransferase domain